ncbi:MAG TPA: hypothetical protein VGF67_22675 [Ktedonobacteraceae bacterium]|jgi:hypothetical protein
MMDVRQGIIDGKSGSTWLPGQPGRVSGTRAPEVLASERVSSKGLV